MSSHRHSPAARRLPAALAAFVAAALAAAALPAPGRAAAKAEKAGPDTILATVGDRTITLDDLRQEWERLTPNLRPSDPSPVVARQMLLEDLVTRDLLGLEAERHPRPMTDVQKEEYEKYRQTLMKNELFKQDVLDVIDLDAVDRGRFRKQMTTILYLRAFAFDDRQAAQAWNTRLVGGTPAARLEALAASGEPGAPQLLDLGYKIREEFTDSVASVLFALPPTRLSPPLPYQGQWALFRVDSTRVRPNAVNFDDDASYRKELLRVASVEQRERFRAALSKELQVRYNLEAVDTLLNRFVLVPPRIRPDEEGPNNLHMNLPLPTLQPEDYDLVLATTVEGEVRARDLMGYLSEMSPALRPEMRNREQMLPWVDRIAFDQELQRRAEARKLDQVPDVRDDLRLRREKYLVEALYADSVASQVKVDDDSLRALFYADSTRFEIPDKARVWICLAESEPRADSVLRAARAGADLAELARRWSIAPNAAAGGVSEPVTPGETQERELDRLIFSTPVGALAGPVATAQGYAVIKVLERTPGGLRSFREAYPDLVNEYRFRTEERLMQAFLERLRQRYPVKAYPSLVEALVP